MSGIQMPKTLKQESMSQTMHQQISEVTTPLASPQYMRGFDEGRERNLTAVEQTGVNCGCFAAGMAIEALIRDEEKWEQIKEDNPEKGKIEEERLKNNWADSIAAVIEGVAKENHLSCLGEMFSAESLAETVRIFAKTISTETDKDKPGIKVHAEVVPFRNVDELKEVIRATATKKVKILIPYYASGDLLPQKKTGEVSPQEMNSAHWAIINDVSDDYASVSLFEGNHMINGRPIDISLLAESNASLGPSFDWTAYFAKQSQLRSKALTIIDKINNLIQECLSSSPIREPASTLIKRKENLVLFVEKSLKKEEQWKKGVTFRKQAGMVFGGEGEPVCERAELKGKVVLIGKKSET